LEDGKKLEDDFMVEIYKEVVKSDFKGTIIDLETIGEFCGYYDSRKYKNIVPVIFGMINSDGMEILCAEKEGLIPKLLEKIKEVLPNLQRPIGAFNANFEMGSLFHNTGERLEIEMELMNRDETGKFEKKAEVVKKLKIPNYDDPFNDIGRLCIDAWKNQELDKAIKHNRACLLKERDILLKRSFRKPDGLRFEPWTA
jgi:hypothetical protein